MNVFPSAQGDCAGEDAGCGGSAGEGKVCCEAVPAAVRSALLASGTRALVWLSAADGDVIVGAAAAPAAESLTTAQPVDRVQPLEDGAICILFNAPCRAVPLASQAAAGTSLQRRNLPCQVCRH